MEPDLAAVAEQVRRDIVQMAGEPHGTHIGGGLSCTDLLVTLHFAVMSEHDSFVLSKGHAAPALYATLAALGRIEPEELTTYARPGSRLFGHPSRHLPGVEFATGSLGHGLNLSIGLAMAERLRGGPGRVYALLGDGELQEGSVWEGLMYAGHRQLNNLVVVIDRNELQITGPTEGCVGLEPLVDKLRAFRWSTRGVDGHDRDALRTALGEPGDGPVAIIADTVKGNGIPFLEGRVSSHYATLRPALVRRALAALRTKAPSP